MSYTVYVLQDTNGNIYKGMTNDMVRRLKEHKVGKTKTTKKMKGLKIVYREEYDILENARKRELYLKSSAGRKFLHKKLNKWSGSSAG